MERIDEVVTAAKSLQQQMPGLLCLLAGLMLLKKGSFFYYEDEIVGDNIPITLIEEIGR